MEIHIVDLLTRSGEIIFSNPQDLLVLFTGIRRKHETLEIFLYYLFLVGTGTRMEKQEQTFEQNGILGAGMRGQPQSLVPGNFTSVQKLSTQGAVHWEGLPFRGTHSSGMAHTLHVLWLLCGMAGKEGRLMLKRFIRWILPLIVLALIATYIVISPLVAIHAAGPDSWATRSSPIHMVAPNYLLPMYVRYH